MERPPTIRIGIFASLVVGAGLYQVGVWAPAHDRELIAEYDKKQGMECESAGGVWLSGAHPPYCHALRRKKEK